MAHGFIFSPHKHLIHISMKKLFLLFITTLLMGLLISLVSSFLTKNLDLKHYFSDPPPSSWALIFTHNLKFLLYFRIPILGFLYFVYSFFIIFIAIGMAFNHYGIFNTLQKMTHLPIEMLALCIPITLSFNLSLKKEVQYTLLAILLLFIASLLEFYI